MFEHGAPGSWHNCQCHKCMDAFNAARHATAPRRVRVAHGTRQGYAAFNCRCDSCRDAYYASRDRAAAARYLARFGIDLDDVVKQDA